MPKRRTFTLPELELPDNENLGQRLARLRKEKGYTQNDLATIISDGQSQGKDLSNLRVLVSDYERGKVQPDYEMLIRLSMALEVSADDLLGIQSLESSGSKISLKLMRRMIKIENLPPGLQKVLLQTIDMFLKGADSDK